jgi:hypothetical protein
MVLGGGPIGRCLGHGSSVNGFVSLLREWVCYKSESGPLLPSLAFSHACVLVGPPPSFMES